MGFGSRVTVRDVEDGTVEQFTLTLGDALDFENSEISMESPIARALLGKRPGDQASASLPAGSRQYEILELQTLHEILSDGRPGEG